MSEIRSGGFSACVDCVDAGPGCGACVTRKIARAYHVADCGSSWRLLSVHDAQVLWWALQGTLLTLSLRGAP